MGENTEAVYGSSQMHGQDNVVFGFDMLFALYIIFLCCWPLFFVEVHSLSLQVFCIFCFILCLNYHWFNSLSGTCHYFSPFYALFSVLENSDGKSLAGLLAYYPGNLIILYFTYVFGNLRFLHTMLETLWFSTFYTRNLQNSVWHTIVVVGYFGKSEQSTSINLFRSWRSLT